MSWTNIPDYVIDDILGFQNMNQVVDNFNFLYIKPNGQGNIDTDWLTNLAVTTTKIDGLAVTAAKIGPSAVETAKINNLAVTVGKLAGAITIAKMAAVVKTGTYDGDGQISKAVTGVGFLPAAVIILRGFAGATGGAATWMRVTGMSGATSGAGVYSTDAIISLDADGFTVDDSAADNDPNKNGQPYFYMCFK